MLFVLLLLFSGIVALEKQNCDNTIIKLKNREVTQLLSPNHPEQEPPGSTCLWTVIADKGRRIVFMCPFHHTLHETHTPEDVQQCNGEITVSPEGDEETRHCQNRGFSRIAFSNRMVISYQNQFTEPVDNFTCYLYAELKSRWDLRENYGDTKLMDYGDFDYNNITLGRNDMITLIPPSDLEDERGWSNSRWVVSAPWSQITLVCPFTNKPPEPLTMQVVPCYGEFTVWTDEGSKTYHCRERAFSHTSNSGSMTIAYETLKRRPADNFECYVYSKETNPTPADGTSVSPYDNCDHVFNLVDGAIGVMKSPNYPNEIPAFSGCRYTVVAPEGSQILMKCTEPGLSEDEKCRDGFTLETTGRIDSQYCIDENFSRLTTHNWTIVSYYNRHDSSVKPFLCQAYLLEECDNCTAATEFKNQNCDHVLLIRKGEVKKMLSPNHPNDEPAHSTCRGTVVAPPGCRIVLTCLHSEATGPDVSQMFPCNGKITVSTEDRNDSIHCSDRTFSRTSLYNRMVFVYENEFDKPLPPFACTVYAEQQLSYIEQEILIVTADWEPNYGTCDDTIHLSINEKRHFQSPHYPNSEPERSASCWNVTAPIGSHIILSCDFPKKELIKRPCADYLTVSTEDNINSTYCREAPFFRASNNNWMFITYQNPSYTDIESFTCYLFSELELPSNECENCPDARRSPYADCDNIIELKKHRFSEIKLQNYPENDRPGSSCRWTVVAPLDYHIFLYCPDNHVTEIASCNSHFTVSTAGNQKRYCRNETISQFSIENWMIITYQNPSFDNIGPFLCHVYVEEKVPSNGCGPDCPDFESRDAMWNQTIILDETGKGKELTSPNYPDDIPPGLPCHWNIRSPGVTYISMICQELSDADTQNADVCKGYFAIYRTGHLQNPSFQCRHRQFAISSTDSEMTVTYSNQFGLSKKPFKCTVTAVDTICRHTLQVPRAPYNEYIPLLTPYWESTIPPWPSCYWSIVSPPDTQIYLLCNFSPEVGNDTLLVSITGDEELSDAYVRSFHTSFTEVSVGNKMKIQYNITEDMQPNANLGCRVFDERAPPLGEECHCGGKFNKMNHNTLSSYRRIVHGKETLPHQYPMMAAILDRDHRTLVCGATIISNSYALTAAHCLVNRNRRLALLTGGHDRSSSHGTVTDINFRKMHPEYAGHTFDIGIVGVNKPIIFNENVAPVCLPFQNKDLTFVNENVTALGWGYTKPYESYFWDNFISLDSDVLLQIEGTVLFNDICSLVFGDYVADKDICIKYEKETICAGDSGGPLLWKDPHTGLFKLIGIHASGYHCTEPVSQGTRVSYFLDWIEETLRTKS